MKYKLLLIAACLLYSLVEVHAEQSGVSVITGTAASRYNLMGQELDVLFLFNTNEGQTELIASAEIRADGVFTLAFIPPKEGVYVLSYNSLGSTDNYLFYFKAGDNLNIQLSEQSYKLIGENTSENIEMSRWYDLTFPLRLHSEIKINQIDNTYAEYFPVLEEVLKNAACFEQTFCENILFNRLFKNVRELDLRYHAISFIYLPNYVHPREEDFPDFYRTMSLSNISEKCSLLDYPYGIMLIQYIKMIQIALLPVNEQNEAALTMLENPLQFLAKDVKELYPDELKRTWLMKNLPSIQTHAGLLSFEQQFAQYLSVQEKEMLTNKINAGKSTEKPRMINDCFEDWQFEDMHGSMVRLQDIQAKYIYVDFWATWCGPCIQQIPAMEALKEAYIDNPNIAFVSISVDDMTDKGVWKKMVEEKKLGDMQLFAGENAGKLKAKYSIGGIPRFMIFDNKGNIIDNDSPRPSNAELKLVLSELLK